MLVYEVGINNLEREDGEDAAKRKVQKSLHGLNFGLHGRGSTGAGVYMGFTSSLCSVISGGYIGNVDT